MGIFDKLKRTAEGDGYVTVYSPAAGAVVPMNKIEDDVFSAGILGFCCGIEPESGGIFSPIDGTVTQVSETRHAVGIEADGIEILLHIGVDTVEMNGEGFEVKTSVGAHVKRGDPLITADLGKVKEAGHPTTVVTVITNSSELDRIDVTENKKLDVGDELFKIRK